MLLVLAILFLICDSTPTTLTSRQSAWSPSSSATLAAVVMLGPLGAALVGVTSLLSLRRGGLRRAGLQRGHVRAECVRGGRDLPGARRPDRRARRSSFPGIIAPFAAAAAVHVVVNHGLFSSMLLLLPPAGVSAREAASTCTCRCCWSPIWGTRRWACSSPRCGIWSASSPRSSC